MLTATIGRDDAIRGKYDLDVAGHYARPDIFSLHVDTAPRASTRIHHPAASVAPPETSDAPPAGREA